MPSTPSPISPPSPKPIIVGIDLGTTNSLIALCDDQGPRILREDNPSSPTPSTNSGMVPSAVLYQGSIANRIVGAAAKDQAPANPRSTITSVKRLMGRSLEDAAADIPFLPYCIIAGERNTIRIALPTPPATPPLLLSPEEVSSHILLELRQRAERILGQPISKAVITVPAYFDDAQRQATRIAGRLAGLDVVRIVPEPTAAALAYGLGLDRANPRNAKPSTVAVYDLGGGTFDISILRLTPNTPQLQNPPTQTPDQPADPFFFEVLATNGDTHLGGDDIDHLLVSLFEREIAALSPDQNSTSSPTLARELIRQAEAAKIALSSQSSVTVNIPLASSAPITYTRTLTRNEFEALITPLIERTLTACNHAMRDAKVSPDTLDAVVLVGGSTRIPLVRTQLKAHFGLEPYTALNPDEVVALGAAVQAATLSGHHTGTLLLDVIPLSLGLETVGGAVAKIIARNTMVPIKATEMFSTSVDNQTAIRLTIYQGEREMAADCRKLAELILRGVPPMPAGVPQVQVQFNVDVNGVLSVEAVERRSGKRAALQIIPNHGLTPEEVTRIEQESYTFAREDMHRHRVVDLIANTSLDIKWISDGLKRIGHELTPAYREELQASITSTKALIDRARADWKSIPPDDLQRAKESLDRLSVTLHETSIAASLRGFQT